MASSLLGCGGDEVAFVAPRCHDNDDKALWVERATADTDGLPLFVTVLLDVGSYDALSFSGAVTTSGFERAQVVTADATLQIDGIRAPDAEEVAFEFGARCANETPVRYRASQTRVRLMRDRAPVPFNVVVIED